MPLLKFNVRKELDKISEGRKSKVPSWLVAKVAADMLGGSEKPKREKRVKRTPDDVAWLESLYRLQDPRR